MYNLAGEGKAFSSYLTYLATSLRVALKKAIPLSPNKMQEFQECHDRSNPYTTLEEMLSWIDRNIAD